MMRFYPPKMVLLCALSLVLLPGWSWAATPTAEQALKLVPVQPGVDYDRPSPEVAARCKILAKKIDGHVGWIVESPDGVILRKFVDTNDDGVVDQWSYYKDGLEVYRDIDFNYNGKPDQYRWFHTGGSRWGLDPNEDGVIDSWKQISAEEVTAEAVAALATRDADRFARLLLTPAELRSLGLGKARAQGVAEKLEQGDGRFQGDVGPAESPRPRCDLGPVQRQPAGHRARRNRPIDQGRAGVRERDGDRGKRREARASADRHPGASRRRVAADRRAATGGRGASRKRRRRVLLPSLR